jgi:hypothetical protein
MNSGPGARRSAAKEALTVEGTLMVSGVAVGGRQRPSLVLDN